MRYADPACLALPYSLYLRPFTFLCPHTGTLDALQEWDIPAISERYSMPRVRGRALVLRRNSCLNSLPCWELLEFHRGGVSTGVP